MVTFPWVLFPSHMPVRTLFERELMQAGLPFPAHAIETSSTFASILLLAESAQLISLFTSETVDLFARHGLIKRLPIELVSRVEPYSLVRRRGSPLSPSAAMLIEEIKRGLALDGGAFSL